MAIPGIRSDPFPAFNFLVSLIDSSSVLGSITSAINFVAGGGFTECSGLESTLQVEEYSEGGENRFVHKFPTRITYSNILLKRGVTLSEDLWNWHASYINGNGKRRDGVIILNNELQIPIKTWVFKRGLPLKWTGPTFNAAQSAIAVETLEIMHEGLELISAGTALAQAGEAISSAF
ncbi:phage tail protein [Floridanema aerugineum]|uniref:Phage tail protein n=1 Tax=Floridaenema aerugineum BLCC-F46 TaxID=3153654 RepID=A0ABV4XFL4_9CYAN